MAEGGVSGTAEKLKPVPPPKPTCSPLRPTTEELHDSAVNSRNAFRDFFEHSELRRRIRIIKDHPQEQAGELSFSSPSSPRIRQSKKSATLPYKPPILPKPSASFIRGLPVKSLNSEISQKQPSSCHKEELPSPTDLISSIIECNTFDLKEEHVVYSRSQCSVSKMLEGNTLPSSLVRKAPVAKLEEFENFGFHLNPTRPPRSPKNKTGDPFVKCDSPKPLLPVKKKHLTEISGHDQESLRHFNYGKSMSLQRSDAFIFSEIQSKYSKVEVSLKQPVEDSSASKIQIKWSPVPPPRRRRRSDPNLIQGHTVPTKNPVPVYAQVNYSLKKNRRVQLRNSISVDQSLLQREENEFDVQSDSSVQQVPNVDIVDSSDHLRKFSETVNLGTNNCSWLHGETLNNEEKHCNPAGTLNETGILLSGDQHLVDDNFIYCDNLVIKEDKDADNDCTVLVSNGDKMEENKSSIDQQLESKEVLDKCSDTCADCLSTHILELVCDDSLSSSKLDWQSARSSIHSCNDSTLSSGSSCSLIVSETIDEQCRSLSKVDSSGTSNVMDVNSVNMGNDASPSFVSYSGKEENIVEEGAFNLALIRNSDPVNDGVVVNSFCGLQCRIQDREACNSLKGHEEGIEHTFPGSCASESSRRCSRRWSWGCSNDFPDWLKLKLSNSLRFYEKDLKRESSAVDSGILHTQRRSSSEEKKIKDRSTSHVGRKLLSWWGSFGKGNKKYRRDKRLSQFYCEQQDVSEFQGHSQNHQTRNLVSSVSLPSEGLSLSVLEDVPPLKEFSKFPFHDKLETSENSVCCNVSIDGANVENKSESVVPDDNFQVIQHSDSEGEDTNSNFPADVGQSLTAAQRIEKKAFYIAKELMTSERVFIGVLKLLNENFRQAVENAGGESVIPEVELSRIINSLPQLQRLNEDLLRDLEQRIENWTSLRKIADVIVKKGPFLKLYTTYIQNFQAQCNYFDECCQKYPKFSKVVKDFEASPICQKLSIKHFMLKPVQRIPQYRLLLDDYSRNLDTSSPDYEDTQTALKIVSDVAEHANRSIKLGDHLSKLLQLQSQLGNYEIIKPGRMVLKEGELLKLSRKDRQPRYFILLNDCLLYTTYYGSSPSSGFKVNAQLPLTGMKVTTPQAEDYHNEFSIISSTRSFTLSARSLHERQEWVDTLQKAIQDHTSRQLSFQNQRSKFKRTDGSSEPFQLGREAPVWIQDGRVTKCQSCIAEFTVTFRRHHCRACGKVVCGDCSDFRAPLQYMKFQAARVCEECYKTLLAEFQNPGNMYDEIIKKELGECSQDTYNNIRSHFKKLGLGSGKKTRKYVPQRLLEVTANDTGSQISGWLQRRSKRSWKRLWFVLKDSVLYAYKASEDVVALETIPVLGYKVEQITKKNFQFFEGVDARCVFQLTHRGQLPLVFSADSENIASRWISTLQDATVLK